MLPTILPGSLVIAQAQLEYQIDDIVAFSQREGIAQRIVVHRIIDETERGFIIKGDNNPKKDPGFHTSDIILGRVVLAAPYVGDLLGAMRDPLVLIITGLVLAVIQMEQSRRKKKKEFFFSLCYASFTDADDLFNTGEIGPVIVPYTRNQG